MALYSARWAMSASTGPDWSSASARKISIAGVSSLDDVCTSGSFMSATGICGLVAAVAADLAAAMLRRPVSEGGCVCSRDWIASIIPLYDPPMWVFSWFGHLGLDCKRPLYPGPRCCLRGRGLVYSFICTARRAGWAICARGRSPCLIHTKWRGSRDRWRTRCPSAASRCLLYWRADRIVFS